MSMVLRDIPKLIDEPTLGLDVVAKRQMMDFLTRLNQEKKVTILVTSHDMDDLEAMAQRILLISQGRLRYDGSFEALRRVPGKTRVTVTLTRGEPPALEGARLCQAERGVCVYEADLTVTPVQALLGQLSRWENVRDVEITRPSLEQVIAALYQGWQVGREEEASQ